VQQKFLKFIKPNTWPIVLRQLLKDEAIGGKLILLAAVVALIVANTPLRTVYDSFWNQVLSITIAGHGASLDLRHWITEGLMAIFFLVVGLEIKREVVKGQLRHFRTALLPIGAAVGGMIVPAVLFVAITANSPEAVRGWAIPTATDIAFALAVISLLGNRVPSALKLFLLTLAIVDDLGSIAVIALFYGSSIALAPVIAAAAISLGIFVLAHYHRMSIWLFAVSAIAFWYAVFKSGIHPSIAGAFFGFLGTTEQQR
jgi:NhaA family Na+:H+ antiporter